MSYNLNISSETLIGTISQLYVSSNGWQAYTYQNLYAKIKSQNEQSKQTTIIFSLRQKIDKSYFYNNYSYSYSFSINNTQIKSGSVSQGTINPSEKEILSWEHVFQHDNEGKCSFTFSYSGPISVGSSGVTTKNITGSCTIPSFNTAPQILSLSVNSETYGILIGEFSYSGTATKGMAYFNNESVQAQFLANNNGTFNLSYNLSERPDTKLPCTLRLYNGEIFNEQSSDISFNNWPKEGINTINIKAIHPNPSETTLDTRYQVDLTTSDTIANQCFVNFYKVSEDGDILIYSNIYNIQTDEQKNKYFIFYLYDTKFQNNDTFYIQASLYNNGFTSAFIKSNSITITPGTTQIGSIYISIKESNNEPNNPNTTSWDDNKI